MAKANIALCSQPLTKHSVSSFPMLYWELLCVWTFSHGGSFAMRLSVSKEACPLRSRGFRINVLSRRLLKDLA